MEYRMSSNVTIGVASVRGSALSNNLVSEPYLIVDQGPFPLTDAPNYIHTISTGLSKSRNIALSQTKTEYLLFSDDDVTHLPEITSEIENAFQRTGADILTMRIQTPSGSPFKSYSAKEFQHTKRSLFRVNSIEIAVRCSAIRSAKLSFDERFGLGSTFPTGEEIIFLFDAHRAKLNIHYCPITIVIHPPESSGGALHKNQNLIIAKGAMFGRIFNKSAPIYCLAFAFRHYRKSGFSIFYFMHLLIKGVFLFRNSLASEDKNQ